LRWEETLGMVLWSEAGRLEVPLGAAVATMGES
jgi:hypothetical protein